MSKNIIFIFTGTGNSLAAARGIAEELPECEIVSMGHSTSYDLESGYESIGFVFPTYYRGVPRKVGDFVSRLNLEHNKNAYYYAVTTCGRYEGNSLPQIRHLLKRKGLTLHFGKALDMFSNYILAYDMRQTVQEEAIQSATDLVPIIRAIKSKETRKLPRTVPLQELAYRVLIKLPPKMDKYYTVSEDCVNCGLCEKVCPVHNIGLDQVGRPYFRHHCEQCVACIQFCPKRAINYKNKTQSRRRYTHPAVSSADLARLNGFN